MLLPTPCLAHAKVAASPPLAPSTVENQLKNMVSFMVLRSLFYDYFVVTPSFLAVMTL